MPFPGARAPHSILLRLTVALGLALSLTACALYPGAHIDENKPVPRDLEGLVDIVKITPELASAYAQKKPKARPMTPQQREAIDNYEYRVGPGDILTVIVYDHPELTNPAGAGERSAADSGTLVRNDGTIFFPFVGDVSVEGLTTFEVRTKLAELLGQYLNDPQVNVLVARYGSQRVYVTGSVAVPTVVTLTESPLTVIDAVATAGLGQGNININAGGGGRLPDLRNATLTRDGELIQLSLFSLLRESDMTQNYLLKAGDVIHIPPAVDQMVAIFGEVRNPRTITMGDIQYSLTDIISFAGGLNQTTAQPTGVFVLRPKPPQEPKIASVYQLDLTSAAAGLMLGSRFPVQPKDVVFVTAAPLERWNRVIDLLLDSLDFPGNVRRSRDDVEDLF